MKLDMVTHVEKVVCVTVRLAPVPRGGPQRAPILEVLLLMPTSFDEERPNSAW